MYTGNLGVGAVVFVFLCEGEVSTCTYVNGCIVNAVGLVAAPPVGEVNHEVEYRTYFKVFGGIVTVYLGSAGKNTYVFRTGCEAFETENVYTCTSTENGCKPFAGIDRTGGHEALADAIVNRF